MVKIQGGISKVGANDIEDDAVGSDQLTLDRETDTTSSDETTNSITWDDTTLSITRTTGANQLLCIFHGYAGASANDVNHQQFWRILCDSTVVAEGCTRETVVSWQRGVCLAGVTAAQTAGSHTIKVQFKVDNVARTAQLLGSSIGDGVLTVVEL